MENKNKVSSQSVGLDIGLAIGRFFLNTEDLHYGYWPNEKEADIQNLAEAQKAHSQFIIDHIPKKTKSILDVGSGSGNLALKLLNLGYRMDRGYGHLKGHAFRIAHMGNIYKTDLMEYLDDFDKVLLDA